MAGTTDADGPRPKRRRWGRWVGLALVALLLIGLVVRLGRAGRVPDGAVVVVDLRREVPERRSPGIAQVLGSQGPDLIGLRRLLSRATADPRVEGIVLRIGATPLGLGRAQEIAALLEAAAGSGSPVIAFAEGPDTAGCVLASGAGEVWLDPSAPVFLPGVRVTSLFLEDTLARWGLEADLERVGRYKGAWEEFAARGPSEALDASMRSLVASLHAGVVEGIARRRGLDPERVRGLVDRGILRPEAAREAGLVDRLVPRAGLSTALEERLGTEVRPVTAARYLEAVGTGEDAETRIAVVHVAGLLVGGGTGASPFADAVCGAETVIRALDAAADDPAVAGVVLRVDSPGGSAAAADRVWTAVDHLAERKPVVASLGATAASGGYYVASAADAIVARPGTVTGSIGVLGGKFVFGGLLERQEAGVARWQEGRFAGFLDPTRRFTPPERERLVEMLEDGYRTFLDRVAAGRGQERERIEEVAQGRLWTGAQAVENGLADAAGGLDEAVARIRQRAGVDASIETPLARFPPVPGLWDLLTGGEEPRRLIAGGPAAGPAELLRSAFVEGGLLSGRTPLALAPLWIVVR